MFKFIQNWLNRRIIQRSTVTDAQWSKAFDTFPLLQGLAPDEKRQLQELKEKGVKYNIHSLCVEAYSLLPIRLITEALDVD